MSMFILFIVTQIFKLFIKSCVLYKSFVAFFTFNLSDYNFLYFSDICRFMALAHRLVMNLQCICVLYIFPFSYI